MILKPSLRYIISQKEKETILATHSKKQIIGTTSSLPFAKEVLGIYYHKDNLDLLFYFVFDLFKLSELLASIRFARGSYGRVHNLACAGMSIMFSKRKPHLCTH